MPCELDIKAIDEQHYFNQEQMYGQLYTASLIFALFERLVSRMAYAVSATNTRGVILSLLSRLVQSD